MPDVTNVTAQVCPIWFASEWTRACKCGEALNTSIQRNAVATRVVANARAVVLLFIAREFLTACRSLQLFFRKSSWRFGGFSGFVSPKMKRVSENYITKQIVTRTIIDVERWIKLEIRCDVAGETDG